MTLLLPLALGLGLVAPQGDPTTATVDREVAAMGTRLRICVEAHDRRTALAASEAAVAAVEQAERRLSTWRPETELARLNATAVGTPCRLGPQLAAELAA